MSEISQDSPSVLRSIRSAVQAGAMRVTMHAQTQMAIRRITSVEIVETLTRDVAEIIEDYSVDKYSPSCLIYGLTKSGRVLHVQSNHEAIIITSYEPDSEKWVDLKKQRVIQ